MIENSCYKKLNWPNWKNSSNDGVVIQKNPLQVTSDLQRVFLYDHFVISQVFQKLSKRSVKPSFYSIIVLANVYFWQFIINFSNFQSFINKFGYILLHCCNKLRSMPLSRYTISNPTAHKLLFSFWFLRRIIYVVVMYY